MSFILALISLSLLSCLTHISFSSLPPFPIEFREARAGLRRHYDANWYLLALDELKISLPTLSPFSLSLHPNPTEPTRSPSFTPHAQQFVSIIRHYAQQFTGGDVCMQIFYNFRLEQIDVRCVNRETRRAIHVIFEPGYPSDDYKDEWVEWK
jgi:hypothetical protein